MERLLEAGFEQTWRYLLIKIFICTAISMTIYLEVYSEGVVSHRKYSTPWQCFSKAAFDNPNPYFGDVHVNEEFKNIIEYGLLLSSCGALTSIFSFILKAVSESFRRAMSLVDCVLGVSFIFWLLTATLGRFSHTGRVCSGDYQSVLEPMYPYDFQQGQFLFWAVTLGWFVPVSSLLLCTALCPPKRSLSRPRDEF